MFCFDMLWNMQQFYAQHSLQTKPNQPAVMSGFGVDTYIWITIAEPVVTKELVYPNKLTVVALAAENSQVSNQSNHFILKLFYGSTSTVAKIQQDLQGKKGNSTQQNHVFKGSDNTH